MKTEVETSQKFELSLKTLADVPTLLLVLLFLVWTFLGWTVHAQTATVAPAKESLRVSSKSELKNSDFQGSWHLLLWGEDSKDQFNQSKLTLMRLDLTTSYQLTEWAKLNISPTLKSLSGHAQTQKEMDANRDSIILRNASADFTILKNTVLSAGALNQFKLHTPLLLGDRAFPAARITVNPETSAGFQAGAFVQSAVPTSASLTTNTKEFEPTPSFQSAGLMLNYQGRTVTWQNHVNGFEYRNLSTTVATESGLLGNTVYTINSTDSAFTYNYRGLDLSTDLKIDWDSRWASHIGAFGVQNSAAPQGLNQGYLLHACIDYVANSKFTFTPIYEFYRIEPDASVASYSSSNLENNRVGYGIQLKGSFSKRFSLRLGGGEREAIYQNAAQSRERYYELGLETFDAKF